MPLNIMKPYKIKSPSGKTIDVTADSIYHACEIAMYKERWQYAKKEYLKLNKGKK